MSQTPPSSNRAVRPRAGWRNILASQDCGEAQLQQGHLYEASYHNRPLLRLVYNHQDNTITVRCLLCNMKSLALDSFQDYPMIGIVKVSAIRMTVPMNTGRILHHLATAHDEDLGKVDDVDLFNSILDCCHL
jgi:hypothetical protein